MEFIILLKPKSALTSMSSSSNLRRIKSKYNKPVNIRGFWLTYENVTRSFNFVFYCLSLINVWTFCSLIVDSMYFLSLLLFKTLLLHLNTVFLIQDEKCKQKVIKKCMSACSSHAWWLLNNNTNKHDLGISQSKQIMVRGGLSPSALYTLLHLPFHNSSRYHGLIKTPQNKLEILVKLVLRSSYVMCLFVK